MKTTYNFYKNSLNLVVYPNNALVSSELKLHVILKIVPAITKTYK